MIFSTRACPRPTSLPGSAEILLFMSTMPTSPTFPGLHSNQGKPFTFLSSFSIHNKHATCWVSFFERGKEHVSEERDMGKNEGAEMKESDPRKEALRLGSQDRSTVWGKGPEVTLPPTARTCKGQNFNKGECRQGCHYLHKGTWEFPSYTKGRHKEENGLSQLTKFKCSLKGEKKSQETGQRGKFNLLPGPAFWATAAAGQQ